MAGDWIKMRGNLWDDPRVGRLCDLCDSSEAMIVGGLYWLWATADQHTEDGILPGLSLRQIDRKTGIPGFGQALCDIGWLTEGLDGVRIIRFEEHNGASAKRRSLDAQRKANSRSLSASDADKSQTNTGQIAPSCGAREEKRREEKKEHPPTPLAGEFERFWRCYPKRKNRGQAEKAWSKLKPDLETVEAILRAVEVAKAGDDWHRDEGRFIPYPASWLNAKGWLDDPPEAQAPRDWWAAFGFATRDAAVRSGLTEPA